KKRVEIGSARETPGGDVLSFFLEEEIEDEAGGHCADHDKQDAQDQERGTGEAKQWAHEPGEDNGEDQDESSDDHEQHGRLLFHEHSGRLNLGDSGTKHEFITAKSKDNKAGEDAGGNEQSVRPGIVGAARWHFRGENRGVQPRSTADALDFCASLAEQLVELAGVAQCVAAAIAHLQAKAVELERVGDFGGILRGEQLLQVAKEALAGEMASEELFLQRAAGPVAENRALQIEDAFVEEGDGGEDAHLDGVAGISGGTGILHSRLQGMAHLSTEAFGILHMLALEAHTQNGGEYLL